MTIDWSDTTLRTLDELAATVFPVEAGITKDTLKRRIRQGTLVASRPGRQFLSSYAEVHAMIERLQVKTVRHRTKPAFPTAPPRHSEMERASRELDRALEEARERRKAQQAEERSKRQKRTR